jgi:hypothetical protein
MSMMAGLARHWKVVCPVLLMGILWASHSVMRRGTRPPTLGPTIVCVSDLDFGEVWEQKDFHWTLRLRNVDTAPVEIVDFTSSCSCAFISPKSTIVGPGESSDIAVTLNLNFPASAPSDLSQMEFSALIIPRISSSSTLDMPWKIRGHVKRAISLDPKQVDLGGDLICGRIVQSKVVMAACHSPLAALRAELDTRVASIRIDRTSSEPNGAQNFTIRVTACPRRDPGLFEFDIPLHATLVDGVALPPVLLHVRGIAWESTVPVPSSLLFGAVTIGKTATETVSLECTDGNFEVECVEPASELIVEPKRAGYADQKHFAVHLTPLREGDQALQLGFQVRQEGEKAHKVVVAKVFYHGISKTP